MHQIFTTITDLLKKESGITALHFQEAVLEAVKDGKLTKEEIDTLEKKREELGLSLEVLESIRVNAYVRAFQTVSSDADITEDEWDELEQIQDYLGVKDREIAKSKKELYRLRVISEIRKGNMPILSLPHLIAKAGETAYWSEAVTLFRPIEKKTHATRSITLHLSKGQNFHMGITKAHDETGLQEDDKGQLILTNKRIVFKGTKETFAITPGQLVDMECYLSAVRLHVNRRQPMLFRYLDQGNHDIVGSVLFSIVENTRESA